MLTPREILLRIVVAFILSSIIGMEREVRNQPAGLRTHILVCIGSTLVMLVSLHLFELYSGRTNMDPARLGAQVISGIGFLGAGTILKEGASIRGLTTAAGLWTVACIGLAVGAGFYIGAAVVAVGVVITLIVIRKIELKYIKTKNNYFVTMRVVNRPGQLGKIGTALGSKGISIRNIAMSETDDDIVELNLFVKVPEGLNKIDLVEVLTAVDGVNEIVDVS